MSATSLCWLDGKISPTTECQVSVLDHGLLYGDGIFEGLRFYRGQALHLERHLQRLQDSARAIQLALPYSPESLRAAVADLIARYPQTDGYIRLVVTRGVGNLGLNPRHCPRPTVFMIADQLQLADEAAVQKGLRLITSTIRRTTGSGLDPRVKSLNYLPSVLARIEANAAEADEAVLLNERGFIAEATAENLFIEQRGELITPPLQDGALGGITRAVLLELAGDLGIPVREASMTPYDVYNARSCFLSGSGAGLLPVRELDGRVLPEVPGAFYRQLRKAYQDYIERTCGG